MNISFSRSLENVDPREKEVNPWLNPEKLVKKVEKYSYKVQLV